MPGLFFSVDQMYEEIRNRQEVVGRISLVEFDDAEYQQLKHIAQRILVVYGSSSAMVSRKMRITFLAFTCEFVRRKKAYDHDSFWNHFQQELGFTYLDRQIFIRDMMFWPTFREEGFELKRRENGRLVVETLLAEVNSSKATQQACIDFFCWYYQRYAGDPVTRELILQYEEQERQELSIHEKAIPQLDHDVQLVANIVTYATDHDVTFNNKDPESYHQVIIEEMGPEYDISTIRFIRKGERLKNLFERLENHITPNKFLLKLSKTMTSRVTFPIGYAFNAGGYSSWPNRLTRSVTEAAAHLRTRPVAYGSYSIDKIGYQVVPYPWLSLETIERWPYGELITDIRSGHIGYKKQQPFEVSIGGRSLEGRLCYARSGGYYIWVGAIPKGEQLFIDGHRCPQTEEIDWNVALQLHLSEDQMRFQLVFTSLKAFFPSKSGKNLTITTSQGHRWEKYLNLDGQLKYSRAITFSLPSFTDPVTITVYLEDHLLGTRVIHPEAAYLFSAYSRERIPSGTKRAWSEQSYYLLSSPSAQLHYDSAVLSVEPIEEIEDDIYVVSRVMWENAEQPFSLQVAGLGWTFQQPFTIALRSSAQIVDHIHLNSHQLYCFSQASLRIVSTIAREHLDMFTCHIYSHDELLIERDLSECLPVSQDGSLYYFTPAFLQEVDRAVKRRYPGQLRYRQYSILLSRCGETLDNLTVTMLPRLQCSAFRSALIAEGQRHPVTITAADNIELWDANRGVPHASVTLQIRPQLQADGREDRALPQGISALSPQPIRQPITVPALGETLEMEFTPLVFGFRLYKVQTQAKKIIYTAIDTLDYYTLEQTAMVIYTEENANIAFKKGQHILWNGKADKQGILFVDSLRFLQAWIDEEQTSITLVSQTVSLALIVHWRPRIFAWSAMNGHLYGTIQGPKGTGIAASVQTTSHDELLTHILHCTGKRMQVKVNLESAIPAETLCYILAFYMLSDGSRIAAAHQARIRIDPQRPTAFQIPQEWLNLGIALSDETLLEFLRK